MIGAGGALFTCIQLILFEWPTLQSVEWTLPVVFFLAGYIICLFLMYVTTSVRFLRKVEYRLSCKTTMPLC